MCFGANGSWRISRKGAVRKHSSLRSEAVSADSLISSFARVKQKAPAGVPPKAKLAAECENRWRARSKLSLWWTRLGKSGHLKVPDNGLV